MSNATLNQARDEIARREIPKADRPAPDRSNPATRLLNADLHAIVLSHKVDPAPTATTADPASKKATALKKRANKAFSLAFAAADDGDKRRAAGKAYRAVMSGTPLTQVAQAIAESANA